MFGAIKVVCLICNRIDMIKNNINPYFVKEMETGYVVIGDFQFYKGYTLFLCKEHVKELHQLTKDFRRKFLNEMSIVAEVVFKAFNPKKLNYELLGNTDFHLHWHIFPRHFDDPDPNNPIWVTSKNVRCSDDMKPTKEELEIMKRSLLKEFDFV